MANKFLSAIVTVAAIGGVCYAFRDKIKESKVYQSLDVDEKVEKVKTTIKEKMPTKDESDRDYFTLNEDDVVTTEAAETAEDIDAASNEDAVSSEDVADAPEVLEEAIATDVSESASDVTAMVDDLLSDIPEIQIAEEDVNKEEESPIIYENEGLSDSSEDLDVIEEQDKLDI